VLVVGALVGLSYGLLGVCLVLVFRTSQVVNFAQPMIGTVAAAMLPALTVQLGLPYWVGFALVLVAGFAIGAAVNLSIIQRFRNAPRVIVAAATIGVAIVLFSLSGQLTQLFNPGRAAVSPPGLFEFSIGPLLVTREYTGLIIAAPILVAALSWFMLRTRHGLAIRASAANPDAAALAGMPPVVMTSLAWGISGLCAAALAVFFTSSAGGANQNDAAIALFENTGVLPALAAAAIAGMTSYAGALLAGVAIGTLQQVMLWSEYADYTYLVILIVTALAILLRRSVAGRPESPQSWAAVSLRRALPPNVARLWSVRLIAPFTTLLCLALVVWWATRSTSDALTWTSIILFALLALSLGLIVGLGGDLSLGQYAIAGVGGAASFLTITNTGSQIGGLLAAAVAGGAISALIAYPCLKVGGLTLTVLSTGLAIALPPAVLQADWVFGSDGVRIGQPVIAGFAFTLGVPYFFFCLVIAGLCALVARNLWAGGFGRLARATRDNSNAARSFGIHAMRVRLSLFVVTGIIAGLAGALLIQSVPAASADMFPSQNGAVLVFALVLGGVMMLSGGPLGVVALIALPLLYGSQEGGGGNSLGTAVYTAGLLIILMVPGGFASVLLHLRDLVVLGLARLHGLRISLDEIRGAQPRTASTNDDEAEITAEAPAEPSGTTLRDAASGSAAAAPLIGQVSVAESRSEPLLSSSSPAREDVPLLAIEAIRVTYGGVHAVDGVSFAVQKGETLGLIGPNGAGKTTCFEVLSGFVRPAAGTVLFEGRDITRLSPEKRAELGILRSFQDAALFPTLNVRDVIMVALEREHRTNIALSALGIERSRRARAARVDDLIDYFGLGGYRAKTINELSTGTRRIVELACLIALKPRVLLLDEPSSGIAQRETEALAELLCHVRSEFETTMILIEHDIPLVMSLSDRIVAMVDGNVLCEGEPQEVRQNPDLINSYLGTRAETITRSNVTIGQSAT